MNDAINVQLWATQLKNEYIKFKCYFCEYNELVVNGIATGLACNVCKKEENTMEYEGFKNTKYSMAWDTEVELYRITAVRDIGNHVKAGDVGGFIEKPDNLSELGDCWVYDYARVCGNAEVSGNAEVCGTEEEGKTEGVVEEMSLGELTEELKKSWNDTDDMVNSPPHYNMYETEVIDVIKACLSEAQYEGYLLGNMIKYRMRAGWKNKDKRSEDLDKSNWYQDRL